MCTHAIATLMAGLALAAGGLFVSPAHAQVRPAVQEVVSKPIGRIVVAIGAVTIERANALVVQASTSGQAGQANVGDLVYQGDIVATGGDGRVGINFTDGSSFNLSNNARMALDEFVYDPKSASNSTLAEHLSRVLAPPVVREPNIKSMASLGWRERRACYEM